MPRRSHLALRFAVVAVVGALAACSSSTKRLDIAPVEPTSTVARARAVLQFRVVKGTVPYRDTSASTSSTTVAGAAPASCENGKLVTSDVASASVILPDRLKTACYALGPVVLSARTDVASVKPMLNSTTGEWELDITFANDDFVQKVARPYVNQQIAIVLDHVVESAPTIDMGITGRDITISGSFDESTARAIAQALS